MIRLYAQTAYVKKLVKAKAKQNLPALLLAAMILLLSAYMVYWGTQKEGYYVDDIYSVMTIRGGGLNRPYNYDEFYNTWHVASDLEATVGVASENAFTAVGQSRSIFVKLLHIAYSLQPDEFSVWPGLFLNLIFYICTLAVIYKLSRIFIKNDYLALLPVLLWGISSAAINMVVFIRLYTFKIFICTLLIYVIYKAVLCGFRKWQHFPIILLLTYIGTVTHQYFFVFAFFTAAFVCLYLLVTKNFKPLLIIAGTILAGIAAYELFTRGGLTRVLTASGSNNAGKAMKLLIYGPADFADRARRYLDFVSDLVFAGINIYAMLALFVLLAVIICVTSSKEKLKTFIREKETHLWFITGGICVCYLFIIMRISPWAIATERYIVCVMPLVLILFISLLIKALESAGFRSVRTMFTLIAATGVIVMTLGFKDIHVYNYDREINDALKKYHHLPVISVETMPSGMAHYYWQLFEFENDVLFALTDNVDYYAIGNHSFNDGLLLITEAPGGNPAADISAITEAAGLSNYRHILTLPNRHRDFYYYLIQ